MLVALAGIMCLGLIAAGSREIRLSRQRRAALRRWIRSEIGMGQNHTDRETRLTV